VTDVAVESKAPIVVHRDEAFWERVRGEKRRLQEAGVKYCFASWVDISGRSKAKFVPVERFEQLVNGSERYTAQAFEVMGPLGPQDDDQAAVPDLDSLTICPWDRQYAWMASDIYWHGKPYEYCSRSILKRVVEEAKNAGYAMMLGIEPEFYILRKDGSNQLQPFHPNDVGPSWGYDVESTLDAMPILSVLQRHLDELGWEVHSFDHEGGHSQYEFDFTFADVLTMCDRFIFLRLMLKEVAKSFGAFVTFMPKPFANDFRSGAHLNMSLVEADSGRNLMRDLDDPRSAGFSELAYQFVAGLLKHAAALVAVSCPTVNGYKGFVPGGIDWAEGVARDWSWAPTYIAYGDNNRGVMLRLPNNRDCVENRVPDISMNPYWAAAFHLAAGLEGIQEDLDPGEPINENVYERSPGQLAKRGIARLPSSLQEALDAFEADSLSGRVFGEGPKQEYLEAKRREWMRFNRHVSEWEIEHYLHFF
jgi:glutamine synthetase